VEEAFLRKVLRGEASSVGTQLSMKVPNCSGNFPTRLVGGSISHQVD